MSFIFFAILVALFLLATIYISAPWFKTSKSEWGLPLILSIMLAVFASAWYFFAGQPVHVIYAQDNLALQQIALLLEDTVPLPPHVQDQINEELKRQEQRAGAQPTVWILQAQLALQHQNYIQAKEAYAQAYSMDPTDPDIAVSYAQTWYLADSQEISPELQQFLHKLHQEYPNQEGLINLLGVVAFHEGDYNKAIQHWQQLITLYPSDSPEAQALQAAIVQAETEKLQSTSNHSRE